MTLTAADYQRYQEHGGLADLSARAKFRLTGGDRVRYLNGQVTANVTRLAPGQALPACITTAKGRLNGELFITAEPDALLIDTEPELRESLHARIERYIIADDVTLTDVTEEHGLLHVLHRPPPDSPGRPVTRARRFGEEGWDLWLPASATVSPSFPDDAERLSPELLELLRIEAGVPRWGRELGEETLPPEAVLDLTHIDYHKGCYIGQEVISRVKSVGHVNRHLRGFTSPTLQPLPPGGRLFSTADAVRQWGTLTSTAFSFALAKPIALGYLKRGSPEDLIVRPAHGEEPALEIALCELPFTAP